MYSNSKISSLLALAILLQFNFVICSRLPPVSLSSTSSAISGGLAHSMRTWEVIDPSTNQSCILLRGILSLSFNQTDVANQTVTVSVPFSSSVSGSCGEKDQFISLEFPITELKTPSGVIIPLFEDVLTTLTFHFFSSKVIVIPGKAILTDKYVLQDVGLTLTKNTNPLENPSPSTALMNLTHNTLLEFPAISQNHSFSCTGSYQFTLGIATGEPSLNSRNSNNSSFEVMLHMENFRMEAFRRPIVIKSGSKSLSLGAASMSRYDFSKLEHCPNDTASWSGYFLIFFLVFSISVMFNCVGIIIKDKEYISI